MALPVAQQRQDQQDEGKERHRQINAIVNVNVHIDRNLLADRGKVSSGSIAANNRVGALTLADRPAAKQDVGALRGKSPDGRLVTVMVPSDRTATDRGTPNSSEGTKAMQSDGAGPPSERTRPVWIDDQPITNQSITDRAAIAHKPADERVGAATPAPVQESGVGDGQAGPALQSRQPFVNGSEQPLTSGSGQWLPLPIAGLRPLWEADLFFSILACSFIPIACLLGPVMVGHLHCALAAFVKASQMLNLITWKMVCDICNELCQVYGLACTEYCASGMQRESWR